jgi:hypothetical protein
MASAQGQTGALASDPFSPFPPVVKFINGQYAGTIETQGKTLPITGTVEYLTGTSPLIKLVTVNTGGQQITSDSWVTSTPTVINEWEIVSTDPTTCRKEVFSGDSYPQCTPWNQSGNAWSLGCTVTVQGKKAALNIMAVVNSGNQLVQLQEKTTIGGRTGSITIQVTSQSTTPPPASDFDLPSICNAPSGNN